MATPLAIGYLAARPRNARRGIACATAHDDPIASRPPIPRSVVTWPAPDDTKQVQRSLDGALMGAIGVLLLGLAAIVAWNLDVPPPTWVARDEPRVPIALIGRIPVVEMRILESRPLASPASADERAIAWSELRILGYAPVATPADADQNTVALSSRGARRVTN